MSSENAIRVSGLGKSYPVYDRGLDRLRQALWPGKKRFYREFWALRGASFEVKKGETLGLIGRNGSGKSTLLQMICGTLTPTEGEIEVRGRVSALLELGAGFDPEFTGRENVYLNGAILGLSRDEIDARYDEIAAFAGIGGFIERPVKTYSSGMYVRLAFAVAIAVEPDILVVDEALSVGDEAFQRKCFSRIQGFRERGGTVLFVSHAPLSILELCDRTLLLDGGELLLSGHPKRVVAMYQKLLYAPAEKAAAIKDEIRRGTSEDLALEPARVPSAATAAVGEESEEHFDPALVPQSTMAFEPQGARISETRVLTLLGERVNHLKRGRQYLCAFQVGFDGPAEGVRFGMSIKTTSGYQLGGGVAGWYGEPLKCAEDGLRAQVEFRFDCNLLPGVYFLNVGVTCLMDGERRPAHGIVDAAMFRVQPDDGSSALTGAVDFHVEPLVRWSESKAGAAAAEALPADARRSRPYLAI